MKDSVKDNKKMAKRIKRGVHEAVKNMSPEQLRSLAVGPYLEVREKIDNDSINKNTSNSLK